MGWDALASQFLQDFLLEPGGLLNSILTLERAEFGRFPRIQIDDIHIVPHERRCEKNEQIEFLGCATLKFE